jgi:hypothetical protein
MEWPDNIKRSIAFDVTSDEIDSIDNLILKEFGVTLACPSIGWHLVYKSRRT